MGVILFSGTLLHNPPQLPRFKLLSDNLLDDSETDSHVQSPLSEAFNMILFYTVEMHIVIVVIIIVVIIF